MKLKDNPHIFAVFTILLWSSGFVFTRLALRYFTPLSLGFLRYAFASVPLIIFAFFFKLKMPRKGDIIWFVLAGFFGFFAYMVTFNIGSLSATASTCSLVIATSPVITTLLAGIIYREKLKVIQYIAIIIEFAGVGVLTLLNGIFSVNSGLIWLILASVSLSIYNLIQRKLIKTYSAIQAVIFSIWLGSLLLMIFIPGSVTEIKTAPAAQIFYLIILGVFASAIAFIFWTHALSKAANVSTVTNYMFITPFSVTLLGFFLVNETPDTATITGGIIIIAGMFLYNFHDKIFKNVN
ncbi:MAG: DMT family transporter [Treponema sp.]|nr:DMT family transporter [Treponema sp.]